MAFTQRQLDELGRWVERAPMLAEERRAAQRHFFGEDDPRPVGYWEGAGDATSRQRRFTGYFLFRHRLPDGRTPAELAADALFTGREREEALRAVRGARYLMAVVRSVLPGEAVFLALERERFEVRHKEWSWRLTPQSTLYCYLVPSRRGIWLAGPGWLQMPIRLGPGMRSHLRDLQPDPVSLERLLQGRGSEEKEEERPRPPRDETLIAAVERMTTEAEAAGKGRLVLSSSGWEELVQRHMANPDMMAFSREIIERVGDVAEVAELDRWLALAHNIWNNTPQPDRGGKTPNELSRDLYGRR
jgi:hypothetical protein